ncbi:Gfo/Idh/MocA family protein [Lacibacterium aquatile]|uniref:Gfo/Idh/MocA family protein n=1 Tax=Lacibacterium aquatile TaxID=1168082 RepID=A0ABW5DX57_9PROT
MKTFGIGIVGCGNISTVYFHNTPLFKGLEVRACADLNQAAAERQAEKFKVRAVSLADMLADPTIDIIVNLTVPNAHFDVSMAALNAGKHVYSEKPLCLTLDQGQKLLATAKAKGVLIGVAPDTFLGAAGRKARELVDAGKIGKVTGGTAFIMGRGMEHWHPDPSFFFQPGGGPILDMGPYYISALVNVLGPVKRVSATSTIGKPERIISTPDSPKLGQAIKVETPTTIMSVLEFASGASVLFGASWDVMKHSHPPLELYGTLATMKIPDPNFFGGAVEIADASGEWVSVDTSVDPAGAINWPVEEPKNANYRVLGIADLADAVRNGSPHRSSATVGVHVLDVLLSILRSGEERRPVDITTPCQQPAAWTNDALSALFA